MAVYENGDDVFGSSASHFLSPKKSPSRQTIGTRRSTASLRSSSSLAAPDDDAATGRFSLAHELAVALMPEPSAGSRLLAEEFGIEYDEGAEGIDEHHIQINNEDQEEENNHPNDTGIELTFGNGHISDPQFGDIIDDEPEMPAGNLFGSSAISHTKRPEKDAMEVLSEDLESTDKFLSQLRTLDVDHSSSGSHQPALERMASDVIRKLNDTARDREGQVRELLEYEREFRRIAGEVGGSDVLAQLDELSDDEELQQEPSGSDAPRSSVPLDILEEDPSSNDWELDPDQRFLGDDDASESATPIKDSFPLPPALHGPPTPAQAIPQLSHLRTFTTSLVASLTTISEQAQVNGAATTEAGRKIRALKNKLGGWRTDWDSAERSRVRIERWEAGIPDPSESSTDLLDTPKPSGRRIDGRLLVKEHLQAFEGALADAAIKTTAIMAS